MTRQTALELIRRLDQLRVLADAGRVAPGDYAPTEELWRRVDAEDRHQRGAR